MRFLLFDRITEVEGERKIRGTKAITLADPAFEAHFERSALFPSALVIEAMVQLTGWLAIRRQGFAAGAVLSSLEEVAVPADLRPGCLLDLEGEIVASNPKGSVGRARALLEGREVARIGRVMYAHLPGADRADLERRFRHYGGVP